MTGYMLQSHTTQNFILRTGLPIVCLSQACTQSAAPETILKKKRFCRRDNIKRVTRFTIQPKWAPEIGQRIMHWNFEK